MNRARRQPVARPLKPEQINFKQEQTPILFNLLIHMAYWPTLQIVLTVFILKRGWLGGLRKRRKV